MSTYSDSTRDHGTSSTDLRQQPWSLMLNSVAIKNFRGFGNFGVKDLPRINLIVGDNAVGKTALLEAIFLTMSGSADKGLALKGWRGLDITVQKASADTTAEAIYGDLFHDPSAGIPITIELTGAGFENRKLTIAKTLGDVFVPTTPAPNRKQRRSNAKKSPQSLLIGETTTIPISLTWRGHDGIDHVDNGIFHRRQDLTYFIIHQLNVIERALADLQKYLKEKTKELNGLSEAIGALGRHINRRQLGIVQEALKNPAATFGIAEHAALHRTSYLTARADLEKLEKMKLLTRTKSGAKLIFRVPSNLNARVTRWKSS